MPVKIMVDKGSPSALGSLLGTIGTIGGGIIGSILAPGGGTLAGAALGGSLGGTAGRLGGGIADDIRNRNYDPNDEGVPVGGSAIQRRMDSSTPNYLGHVENALNLAHTLPQALREEYVPHLSNAFQQAGGFNLGSYKLPDVNVSELLPE